MSNVLKHNGAAFIRWAKRGFILSRKKINEGGQYQPLPSQLIKDFNKTRPLGPQPVLCYAPFKMMYFAFDGEVIACCHNRKNILGRFPDQSLEEIWNGQELSVLRKHIENDDLSYGCEVCKTLLLSRNFDGAKNALYDRYHVRSRPVTMEFELSNNCNLSCVICNELFSSRFQDGKARKSPYDHTFIEQLLPFIPHLKEAKFYGGEPFLIPIYYEIWDKMLALNPRIHILIQTNGTILSDSVEALLKKGTFSINVSIDSFNKQVFEQIRRNANFEKTIENTQWFAEYCHKKGTHFGITPTPNRLNWMDLAELTMEAGKLDARIYFNTLITPLEYALWNLPPDELNEMHKTLSECTIPGRTLTEKANKRHFEDFLIQLKAWEHVNMDAQQKNQKTSISFSELQHIKEKFLANLTLALKEHPEKEHLMELFLRSMKTTRPQQENDIAYLTLSKVPMKDIVKELETLNIDHLEKLAGKKLFEANGQYIISERLKS